MSDGSDPRHANPEQHEQDRLVARAMIANTGIVCNAYALPAYAIDDVLNDDGHTDVRSYHKDKVVADAVAMTKGRYGVVGKVREVRLVTFDGKVWYLIGGNPVELSDISRKDVAEAAYNALTPEQQAVLKPFYDKS